MKVIIVSQKNEFDQEHLKHIEIVGEVVWIDVDQADLSKLGVLADDQEKILAISPVPFNWSISAGLYDLLNNVKAICLPTTAYDFLDLKTLKQKGIFVTNAPYYSTMAVAEYAWFMFLALLKRLPAQLRGGFEYGFKDDNLMDELAGKTVGIVGLGHIGQAIAQMATQAGLEVRYWSREKKTTEWESQTLDKILAESDVIFPTFVLNEETKKLLGKSELEKVKESAYVVNIVGEEACDTQYLIERVSQGKLAGLAFESSKVKMSELSGNVFITAPQAWYTRQSLKRNIDLWTQTIVSCVEDKPINRVGK